MMRITALWALLLCATVALAESETDSDSTIPPIGSDLTPDVHNDDTRLKLRSGDVVVVAILFQIQRSMPGWWSVACTHDLADIE